MKKDTTRFLSAKRRYSAPCMSTYGTVAQLTKGGGSSMVEHSAPHSHGKDPGHRS